MYAVWMEIEQNGRKNIGQLKTSIGLRTSSLKTVSGFKPNGFFITAADDAIAVKRCLAQDSFNKN